MMRWIVLALLVILLAAGIVAADFHPDPGVHGLYAGEAVIVYCADGQLAVAESGVAGDGTYMKVECVFDGVYLPFAGRGDG